MQHRKVSDSLMHAHLDYPCGYTTCTLSVHSTAHPPRCADAGKTSLQLYNYFTVIIASQDMVQQTPQSVVTGKPARCTFTGQDQNDRDIGSKKDDNKDRTLRGGIRKTSIT
jgi:hypothetical protein